MKTKKMLKGMMAVAIVAVAGLALYANQPKEEMTDVMLANSEALADIENPTYCPGGLTLCAWIQSPFGSVTYYKP